MRKLLGVAVASVAALMALGGSAFAAGDAAKGKEVFTTALCATCHQVGPGAKNGVGPELNGIVGRKAASVADYPSYSAGMKKLGAEGCVWTEENIDKWIANPKAMIPEFLDGAHLSGAARRTAAGGRHCLSEDPDAIAGKI